jgi:hypothetical protein
MSSEIASSRQKRRKWVQKEESFPVQRSYNTINGLGKVIKYTYAFIL